MLQHSRGVFRVQILVLLLTGCVTLGKLLTSPWLSFLHSKTEVAVVLPTKETSSVGGAAAALGESLPVASGALALLLCRRGRAFRLHFPMRMLRFGERLRDFQAQFKPSLLAATRAPSLSASRDSYSAPATLGRCPFSGPFLGELWGADLILFVKLCPASCWALSLCV